MKKQFLLIIFLFPFFMNAQDSLIISISFKPKDKEKTVNLKLHGESRKSLKRIFAYTPKEFSWDLTDEIEMLGFPVVGTSSVLLGDSTTINSLIKSHNFDGLRKYRQVNSFDIWVGDQEGSDGFFINIRKNGQVLAYVEEQDPKNLPNKKTLRKFIRLSLRFY